MISVLISTINEPQLARTIDSVREAADGEVEFIIINDGGESIECPDVIVINHPTTLGRRVSFNEAARKAMGDYLLILDAHCSMSAGWDTKMAESCTGNNLVHCVIKDMNPDTWDYFGGDYLHVYMNKEYTEKWWNLKPLSKCEVEEENMCATGCAWMVSKENYWRQGGYDESLGKYGWDGPEWTCKIWMGDNPGRVILRTDVICGHIFGTNFRGKQYKCDMIPKPKYVAYMKERYADKIEALAERFKPVPGWHEKEKPMAVKDGTGREVKLERQKEMVTRNEKGEVIKKVVQYFEYVFCDDGSGPTEEEILADHKDDLKLTREEQWTLQNGQLLKSA